MCRKSQLRGWCAICFGAGILLGHQLDSWIWCGCGGIAALVLGFLLLKQR